MNPIAIVLAALALAAGIAIAGAAIADAIRTVDANDEWWDGYQLGRREAFEQLAKLAVLEAEAAP